VPTPTRPPPVATITPPVVLPILQGRWEGQVYQPGVRPYTTILVLTGCEPNMVCGSVDYPEASCGGIITFLGTENGRYRLRENITYGTENCVNEVIIELLPIEGNWWGAVYYWSGPPEGSGGTEAILEKSE